MTDEKTPQPRDDQSDGQAPVPEGAPPEGTPTPDTPPSVAGEQEAPPPQDPTILGALTPQENAMLTTLRRQSQQLTLEVGKLELQKGQILERIRSNDEQSQSVLRQIGQRLGIPEDVSWTVGGDGNARALPPNFMQAMQGGMPGMGAPPPRPASQPPAAATVTQPSPDEGAGPEGDPEEK